MNNYNILLSLKGEVRSRLKFRFKPSLEGCGLFKFVNELALLLETFSSVN